MKLFLLMILLHLTSANNRYHEMVGVPEASRIRERERDNSTRIINGIEAFLGQYPYFGGLIITSAGGTLSVCGSTLITVTNLITAAHCWFDGNYQAVSFVVVLGSTALFTGGTRITTSQVITHYNYNAAILRDDIAIIMIPPISLSAYILPVTLQHDKSSLTGFTANVVGFGRTGDQAPVQVYQYLSSTAVTVIGHLLCTQFYGEFFTKSMICTEGIRGSPCSGDSGGPLVNKQSVLIGVVSYGSPYGCEHGHPAVYTRISEYIDWIEETVCY